MNIARDVGCRCARLAVSAAENRRDERRRSAAARSSSSTTSRRSARSSAATWSAPATRRASPRDGHDAVEAAAASDARTWSCSTSCCPASTAWRSCAACASAPRPRTAIILLTARGEESDRVDRAAARRRRLRRQAVLAGRARRARRRRAAPRRHGRPSSEPPLRFGELVIDPAGAAGARRRRGGRADPARVRAAAVPRPPPRPGVHAQPADGPRLAATRSTPTPRPSPSTSAGCAPRSSPTRRSRAGSRRCGASATGSPP